MEELNYLQLRKINGGATIAYRIGQFFRGIFMSAGSMMGTAQFIVECHINENEGNAN